MIVNRNDFIVDLCQGKKVLDLGCACHDLSSEQIKKGIWLHENIHKVASSVMGFDTDRSQIKRLQDLGYEIYLGNIEYIDTAIRCSDCDVELF